MKHDFRLTCLDVIVALSCFALVAVPFSGLLGGPAPSVPVKRFIIRESPLKTPGQHTGTATPAAPQSNH